MKKVIVSMVVLGCFIGLQPGTGAAKTVTEFKQEQKREKMQHRKQQREEGKAFKKSLKGKSREEKKLAVLQRHEQRYNETKEFNSRHHAENMAFMKEKLAENKKLTEARREEIINQAEAIYKQDCDFLERQHDENAAFFKKIADDAGLTQEQKKAALKKHFSEQRAETKAHKAGQKKAGKALKKALKKAAVPVFNW